VAPEAQMAHNIASMAVRLKTKPLVHCSLVATGHSMSPSADQSVTMAAKQTLVHCSLVATGHSMSVVMDRQVPMVAYTLALMAARHLMPKPLAYHSPIATGHSIPAAVALADLEAYTLATQEQIQNSLRFAAFPKGSGMWMRRIWHKMIGLALTRNYNLGSTLFVVPKDVHNQSRRYHLAHGVYYTAHNAFAMMKCKVMGLAIPIVG
jgi:hypothetical protein